MPAADQLYRAASRMPAADQLYRAAKKAIDGGWVPAEHQPGVASLTALLALLCSMPKTAWTSGMQF